MRAGANVLFTIHPASWIHVKPINQLAAITFPLYFFPIIFSFALIFTFLYWCPSFSSKIDPHHSLFFLCYSNKISSILSMNYVLWNNFYQLYFPIWVYEPVSSNYFHLMHALILIYCTLMIKHRSERGLLLHTQLLTRYLIKLTNIISTKRKSFKVVISIVRALSTLFTTHILFCPNIMRFIPP